MTSEAAPRTDGRARKKRATRHALRTATLDLGLERTLPEVRIEEITERAGVSPRTFFNYFETKEDAVLLDLFGVSDARLDELAAGPPGAGTWADVSALLAEDVEQVGHDGPDLPRFLELQRRHPALQGRQFERFARFEARLCAAITRRLGAGAAPLRAGLMSGSCITAVRIGIQQWGVDGWRDSPRPHVEAALAVFAPAFARD